jgi:hypothetical protein
MKSKLGKTIWDQGFPTASHTATIEAKHKKKTLFTER